MNTGKKQFRRVSYNIENYSKRDLYHEFLHVMGLLHEHQNKDRNTYIKVLKNIPAYNILRTLNESLKYDPTSIMHYHPWQGGSGDPVVEMKVLSTEILD